ncbi:MAG: ABC transporter ATP-binding protein [Nitrosomonas sp.]|nr:ABC transporter ATP-binding protein [Nitrosomonas sp.]
MTKALLVINGLTTRLRVGERAVYAVDGLSLEIERGQTFALLGESGCGKSMTALSIMRLLPDAGEITQGSIRLNEQDLLALPESAMRELRGNRLAMIFQEPMLSLNPVMTVGAQIAEVLQRHTSMDKPAAQLRMIELLQDVGIPDPEQRLKEYPFQFSGGMKQRVMIAMALAARPELLIADEPTTALDVTIQAQVLDLMRVLQQQTGMAILLITHDLGVVAEMAHQIGVMYAGEMVEYTSREKFFQQPAHPYSQKLFAALPSRQKRGQALAAIGGEVPPLSKSFIGCRFADRCEQSWSLCHTTIPPWVNIASGHQVRCHLYATQNASQEKPVEASPASAAAHSLHGDSDHRDALLTVHDLKIYFPIRRGLLKRVVGYVKAVDGVSLRIAPGRTLALVGESGCGKTTVGKGIMQLVQTTAGDIRLHGEALGQLTRKQLLARRALFQIVFQDPYSSLNPRMRIAEIIEEGMSALRPEQSGQKEKDISAQYAEIDALLQQVGLPADVKWRYPHEFSGGQRQRIAIARALAVNPQLLICDEPTSALDVSVQAQILNLLKFLQYERGLAYLFITHNITVVDYLADEMAVMYLGRIVESGPTQEVLDHPRHPYTQALLSAIPVIEPDARREVIRLQGEPPSPANTPTGCHFHPRCPHVMPICRDIYPPVSRFGSAHTTCCHLYNSDF